MVGEILKLYFTSMSHLEQNNIVLSWHHTRFKAPGPLYDNSCFLSLSLCSWKEMMVSNRHCKAWLRFFFLKISHLYVVVEVR